MFLLKSTAPNGRSRFFPIQLQVALEEVGAPDETQDHGPDQGC